MSINIKTSFTLRLLLTFFAISAFWSFYTGVAVADDEPRSSISSHTVSGGRSMASPDMVTEGNYAALLTEGARDRTMTRAGSSKPGASNTKPGADSSLQESSSYDFWFYDVDVVLFNDDDFDGYFHGIDVLFDADTNFNAAEIYAVLYLSYEGGPWNEYAATEDFDIFGSSGSDEYVVVTELMSGYPTGSYDLLIELFDAYDGTFLAEFGPLDSSEMSFLALEDFNRDAPVVETPIAVSHGSGGGGAIDGFIISLLLILLLGSTVRKIWRHRNDALMRIDSPAGYWADSMDRKH